MDLKSFREKKKKQSIEFLAGETETESCEIYGKENHNF